MPLITSSWLIGENPSVPATTIDVTANATTETLAIPAGAYYVYDSTATRSAVDTLATVLETHSQIANATGIVRRDLLCQVSANVSYTIDSWSDLSFRDVLGFAGTEAFAGTVQVAGRSRYIWSPGRCEIPDAPLGSQGLLYYDTSVGASGDRVVVSSTHNSGRKNRFQWRRVYNARVATASESNSEYLSFWNAVVRRFWRLKLYREITEETGADATAAVLAQTPLGPYSWDSREFPVRFDYTRELESVELLNSIELPVVLTND